MTDRAILDGNFNLNQCPEVIKLLEAVQNISTTEPNISCSQNCVDLFNTLGESCRENLIEGFKNAKNPLIATYSTEFFNKCEAFQEIGNLAASPVQALPSPESGEPPVKDSPVLDIRIPSAEAPVEIPDSAPDLPSVLSPEEVTSSGSQVCLFYSNMAAFWGCIHLHSFPIQVKLAVAFLFSIILAIIS